MHVRVFANFMRMSESCELLYIVRTYYQCLLGKTARTVGVTSDCETQHIHNQFNIVRSVHNAYVMK